MDKNTRRVLKAKQGRISSGSGVLKDADGYEGQVQVRDTKDGPMLFAKLKGKWIQTPLLPGEDSFTPKAWTTDIIMAASNGDAFATVPTFINLDNVLSINVMLRAESGGDIFYTQPPIDYPGATTTFWMIIHRATREVRAIYIGGVFWPSKPGRLTILYK